MASEKIDNVFGKQVFEDFARFNKEIDVSIARLEKLAGVISSDNGSSTSNKSKAVQNLNTEMQAYFKLQTQSEQAASRIAVIESNANKVLIESQSAYREKNSLLQQQIILNNTTSGTIQKLNAQNAILVAEQKKLNLETLEGINRNNEINKTINENNLSIKTYTSTIDKNKKATQELSKEAQTYFKLQQQAEMVSAKAALSDTNANKQLVSKKTELAATNMQIKQQTQLQLVLNGAITDGSKSLGIMTKELNRMKLAGEDNTEAFLTLQTQAGKLKDEIGEVSAQIKFMSSDTKELDAVISGFEGVAAGIGVAQSAMALFGVENDQLKQTMVKLQAAMTLMQSLQTLQNVLNKESAAVNGVILIQQKAAILQTNLQAAAESKNIVVRWGAVAAQKALNLVTKQSPIWIMVEVIVALAGAFMFLAGRTQDVTKSIEEQNAAIEKRQALAEQEIKLQQALGNQTLSLEIKKQEANIRDLDFQVRRAELVLQYGKLNKENAEKQIQQINDLKAKRTESVNSLALLNAQETKQFNDKIEKEFDATVAINREKVKQGIDANNAIISNEESSYNAKRSALKRNLDAELKLLESSLAQELYDTDAGEMGKLLIKEEANTERKRLELKYNSEVGKLWKEESDEYTKKELKRLEDEKKANKEAVEDAKKAAEEKKKAFDDYINHIRDTRNREIDEQSKYYDDQITAANEAYTKGTMSHDDYQKELFRIEKESAENRLNTELTYLEMEGKQYADGSKERIAIEAKIAEAKKNYSNEAAQVEIDNQARIKEAMMSTLNEVSSAIGEIVKNGSDERIAQYDEEIKKNDEKYEKELAAAEGNEAAQRQIKQRQENDRKRIEKLKKDEAIKQAEFERNWALVQVAIKTAVAIATHLTTPILIAADIAIGAAQAAAIMSKPIPKYFKGTDHAQQGLAWVGEEGSELMTMRDGREVLTPNKPTLTYLQGGEKIKTAPITKQILSARLKEKSSNLVENRMMDFASKEIVNAIKNKEFASINVTERGIEKMALRGVSRTKYINGLVSSKL